MPSKKPGYQRKRPGESASFNEAKDYKIDKGVPIPKLRTWRNFLQTMEPGDSVLVETFVEADNLRSAAKWLDMTACMRRDGKGYRVWRVL